MVAVSVQPSSHPGRSDFPSPVGGGSFFHGTSSLRRAGSSARSRTPAHPQVMGSASLLVGLCRSTPAQCPAAGRVTTTANREPLCASNGVTAHALRSGAGRRALPRLHRSYRLMRQTARLPSASVVPVPSGLCRLCRVPAASRSFPTLSLRSLYRRLGPYPATLGRCICPFLPARPRPLHRVNCIGSWNDPATQLCAGAVFRGCNHSLMFRLRYSLGPQSAPTFRALCPCRRWAVYTALNPRRYRSRAAASLRV